MTGVSLFTDVSYLRPKSFCERTFSTLSHYFYLGGNRAKVIRKNEIELESRKISCQIIALKVASYVLLFPITLTLLAIYFVLRSQRHFTVINSSTISGQKNNEVSESIKRSDSIESEENKAKKDSEEKILKILTKSADREDNTFLIDFSKVNPSNIFKIFVKSDRYSSAYGDVSIDDKITYDESNKFLHNFPYKFSISVVTVEKNEHGYNSSNLYMFTMNSEGKVEFYGELFDNFDLYLDYLMNQWLCSFSFEHLDFHSVFKNGKHLKLRKKNHQMNKTGKL